jgi:hypothetical protein
MLKIKLSSVKYVIKFVNPMINKGIPYPKSKVNLIFVCFLNTNTIICSPSISIHENDANSE